jgi:hypothetical protein
MSSPTAGACEDRVSCGKGCGKTWPRDPALEVPCPECAAPIGTRCRRPSGHGAWGREPHAARDILADQQGHYGPCPRAACGLENIAAQRTEHHGAQADLFA